MPRENTSSELLDLIQPKNRKASTMPDNQDKLQVITVKLGQIHNDPNNARKHDDRNIEAIMESLAKFGQRKPIVITHDKTVIAGNGTVEAARRLGWLTIAAARTPADWSEATIKAYALTDNRTAELATWEQSKLSAQLSDLDLAGWDIHALGFDLKDMDGNQETVEVDPGPPPAKAKTRKGQVWQLGNHRLMVGDATNGDDYKKLMNGQTAQLVITDPPYNVAYVGGTVDKLTIDNDAMSEQDFDAFLLAAFCNIYNSIEAGAPIYVFHADSNGNAFRRQFNDSGFLLKQVLIWVKNTFVMGRQDYHWQHEPILYGWKPGAAHRWFGARTKATVLDDEVPLEQLKKNELLRILEEARYSSTVVREDKPHRNGEHPTMKPIRLIARLMANSSEQTNIILDPFGGSGSTLITAEQLNRTCYTMEMDPIYADVIITRWEKYTKKKASLCQATSEASSTS
jgi:DNA modification methylase